MIQKQSGIRKKRLSMGIEDTGKGMNHGCMQHQRNRVGHPELCEIGREETSPRRA